MSNSGGQFPTPVAPSDAQGNPAVPQETAFLSLFDSTGGNWRRWYSSRSSADAEPGANAPGVFPYGWDGANGQRIRTPNVFKTISVVAVGAETTIWTPAAGKKFRLMGYYLGLSVADRLVFKDNTAGTLILNNLLPAADGRLVTLGNGILSAAANNVLTAQSGSAANLTGFVFGTEE